MEKKIIGGFSTQMFFINGMVVGIAEDIGPRIMYLAGEKRPDFNLLGILPELVLDTKGGPWHIYGGHRLWSSPEADPRSYSKDDKPVKIEAGNRSIKIYGNPEIQNAMQKTIEILPSSTGGIQVIHTITNIGRWPVELACWAVSLMRKNGFGIVPVKNERHGGGLLPDRRISMWPYTDLSDKRLILEKEYIFLKQDSETNVPVKIGTMVRPAWTAYWVEGMLFVKSFRQEESQYPDFGCNVELYTNGDNFELETLSPLAIVKPAESVMYTETWQLFEVAELIPQSKNIEEKVVPLIS